MTYKKYRVTVKMPFTHTITKIWRSTLEIVAKDKKEAIKKAIHNRCLAQSQIYSFSPVEVVWEATEKEVEEYLKESERVQKQDKELEEYREKKWW